MYRLSSGAIWLDRVGHGPTFQNFAWNHEVQDFEGKNHGGLVDLGPYPEKAKVPCSALREEPSPPAGVRGPISPLKCIF